MPAVRLAARRRKSSSHAIFTPAKPGIYGVSPRPVTFAPNVTPITYNEIDPEDDPTNPFASLALSAVADAAQATSKLFPPSETPAPPPARKRCPPGKRRSQGYIPRPPNAFMLFRADFVRQKHVPGSIETNHGSLSKIIGTCWRQLPLEEKRIWEVKAKQEKAAHKAMFPDYRFRPVHNKNKHLKDSPSSSSPSNAISHPSDKDDGSNSGKRKEKQPTTAEDERRCDEVAQLLLEGKKGEELARAVRNLDRARSMERERNELERLEMLEQQQLDLELGLDMDDYELGLGMGLDSRRGSYDFEPSPSLSLSPSSASASVSASSSGLQLHMPVSQHPHAFMNPHNQHQHQHQHHPQMRYHRRSSSVPLPNEWLAYTAQAGFAGLGGGAPGAGAGGAGIAIPAIPQFMSRPASPVGSVARFNQVQLAHHGQDAFTNPFHQTQTQGNFNTEYQFAPIPEFTPTAFNTSGSASTSGSGSHFQQQQQAGSGALFHPSPQHATFNMGGLHAHASVSPRNSFGFSSAMALGMGYPSHPSHHTMHRRASSAQPAMMRSWTMPLPGSSYGDYTMGMSMSMSVPMERDPSPLPDVDPELFGDFSFGKASASSGSGSASASVSGSVSSMGDGGETGQLEAKPAAVEEVDPSMPLTNTNAGLAHIDTTMGMGIAPDFGMHSASSTSTSTSSSSSSTGSPATSVLDLSQHPHTSTSGGDDSATGTASAASAGASVTGSATTGTTTAPGPRTESLDMSAYMHLDDGLYAPDPMPLPLPMPLMMGMDAMYAPEAQHQVYAPEGYAMGMYAYDGVDPVEHQHQKMEMVQGGGYAEAFYAEA